MKSGNRKKCTCMHPGVGFAEACACALTSTCTSRSFEEQLVCILHAKRVAEFDDCDVLAVGQWGGGFQGSLTRRPVKHQKAEEQSTNKQSQTEPEGVISGGIDQDSDI